MHHYILFALYLFCIIVILGFMSIFLVRIRPYQSSSQYISIATKAYFAIFIIIAIIGGYMILTGTIFPKSTTEIRRINL